MSVVVFAQLVLGRPFVARDWDCWALICTAYHQCFGIVLEQYPRHAKDSWPAYVNSERAAHWVEVDKEQPGDVVLFRPLHVGLVIAPGLMVHVAKDVDTCIERFRSVVWRSRLRGIYRYVH